MTETSWLGQYPVSPDPTDLRCWCMTEIFEKEMVLIAAHKRGSDARAIKDSGEFRRKAEWCASIGVLTDFAEQEQWPDGCYVIDHFTNKYLRSLVND